MAKPANVPATPQDEMVFLTPSEFKAKFAIKKIDVKKNEEKGTVYAILHLNSGETEIIRVQQDWETTEKKEVKVMCLKAEADDSSNYCMVKCAEGHATLDSF